MVYRGHCTRVEKIAYRRGEASVGLVWGPRRVALNDEFSRTDDNLEGGAIYIYVSELDLIV